MKLKDLLLNSAPTIAGLIGGPFASTAVSLLESAFGVKGEDALTSAIAADPNANLKLKELELQHDEALQKLTVEDSESARNLAITTQNIWFLNLMTICITVGFFSCIVLLMFEKGDTENHDILNMMLGVLGTAWIQVMSFHFGSTHDSIHRNKSKD